MNIKILNSDDESLMLDLLLSEKKSTDTDYYLDRGTSYWGIYNWFSKGKNTGIGVFDKRKLVGIVTLSEMPFRFKESDHQPYLLSDFFVHPDYRKSFVAARIFTGLQSVVPKGNFIHFAIENRPGFAESIGRFSQKYGHSSVWARESKLVVLYPNQKYSLDNSQGQLVISEDEKKVTQHLEAFKERSNTWSLFSNRIEIEGVFRKVWVFQYQSESEQVSGLLIDRGNLQQVRWNGQSRILVEKYRRALSLKSLNFDTHSELPFLNLCFLNSNKPSVANSCDFIKQIVNFGLQNNYFGINYRDFNLEIPTGIDHVEFVRRVVLSTASSQVYLNSVIEKNKNRTSMVELVYL